VYKRNYEAERKAEGEETRLRREKIVAQQKAVSEGEESNLIFF